MTKHVSLPAAVTQKMKSEAVLFRDGMIVTDDDLTAAMMYPVALMTAVNRAVYGCGVVCGFRFEADPDLCGHKVPCDPCDKDNNTQAYPGFKLRLMPGTAIDCAGYPLELCKPVLVDVSPETCGCDEAGGTVCIAIRRTTSHEAPRGDCCGPGSEGVKSCTRVRDLVEIRAFPADQLPDHTCMWKEDKKADCGCGGKAARNEKPDQSTPQPEKAALDSVVAAISAHGSTGQRPDIQRRVCQCLAECDCGCCGDGWVLLGCIELCKAGIVATSFDSSEATYGRRKYIKTVECLCREPWAPEPPSTIYRETDNREEYLKALAEMQIEDRYAAFFAMETERPEQIPEFIDKNRAMIERVYQLKRPDKLDEIKRQVTVWLRKSNQ